MSLRQYNSKRNFSRTREPAGNTPAAAAPEQNLFVVQKHAATRLHYDFRLQMEGVLKSWAVPKGFPTRRGDRRLAIEVEDHPIGYADFEGTIPSVSYGAGTVMVWDTGTYEVKGEAPGDAWRSGKLSLILRGSKLKGDWTLVRMGPRDQAKPQWLLLKSGSDIPAFSSSLENRSALTRRTMQQIATGHGREWHSERSARSRLSSPRSKPRTSVPAAVPDRSNPARFSGTSRELEELPRARPAFVQPMKALLASKLPKGSQWIYEIKFDGVRALEIKNGATLRLISRNGKDLTAKYLPIAQAIKELPARLAVLDGEIVAVDENGRPDFQMLQCYHMAGTKKPPLFYYVFDLIHLEGRDVGSLPLLKRKALAESLVKELPDPIRLSAALKADTSRVLNQMKKRGLEGLIAKRTDSKYQSGERSGAWIKFKWTNEQEFVIGGYTEPKGTRPYFGSVLVGYYQGDKLLFAGRVGTGFNQKLLASLHARFQKLVQPACPFGNLPQKTGGGLSSAEMRRCTWIEPRLVCQIRFAEWTRENQLRQPSFLGLREDKDPQEVVREIS